MGSDIRETGKMRIGGNLLDWFADWDEPFQSWAARTIGGLVDTPRVPILEKLARNEGVQVRASTAVALRQFTSASLTVDIPRAANLSKTDLLPVFRELLARPSVDGDFYYPHIVWMAMEPQVAEDPQKFFPVVSANENSVGAYCLRRVMRRICDLTDSAARMTHLNAGMQFLGTLASKTTLAEAALDGLIDAFKSKGQPPSIPLEPIFDKLTRNAAIADKARRLATLLGDTTASRVLIAKLSDTKANLEDRLRGVTAARETKDDIARTALLKVFQGSATEPQPLYSEALRAISVFGGDDIAYVITDAWKKFSLPTRRVASEVLVLRSKWSRALLAGVDRKVVVPEDISATARRALARSEDSTVRDHADRVLGKYRVTGEDKLKLIAQKRKVALSGEPDVKAGYEVAKKTCFVCHKLHNEGVADVGPDLTGVGRSTLDALLHNIIDPNEVIGRGYESTEVDLKDGRNITGRIVEDAPSRLKLVASGPTEHILARSDIEKMHTSELSLMPDGLEQMPDADFRNMVWYLLNPPQDKRPMTPELRKELLGQ
jgi:putative heme-binding domain-containing protein